LRYPEAFLSRRGGKMARAKIAAIQAAQHALYDAFDARACSIAMFMQNRVRETCFMQECAAQCPQMRRARNARCACEPPARAQTRKTRGDPRGAMTQRYARCRRASDAQRAVRARTRSMRKKTARQTRRGEQCARFSVHSKDVNAERCANLRDVRHDARCAQDAQRTRERLNPCNVRWQCVQQAVRA